jgi:hypothetical protein
MSEQSAALNGWSILMAVGWLLVIFGYVAAGKLRR